MRVCILAVEYHEPSYQQIREQLQVIRDEAVPVFMVDRMGIGSLAEAFNRGFKENELHTYDYVWMITNIVPRLHSLMRLAAVAAEKHWVGICPAYLSDHSFLRPNSIEYGRGNVSVPFVEFTACMVHARTFAQYELDEDMPYVGHDLDWSYRVLRAGFHVGVCRDVIIHHSYLRHLDSKGHLATVERARLRQIAEPLTTAALVKKYGADWREKLYYKGAI